GAGGRQAARPRGGGRRGGREGGARRRARQPQGEGAPGGPRRGQGRAGARPADQPGDEEVRMRRRILSYGSLAALLLSLAALAGCGYALVGRGANIPED